MERLIRWWFNRTLPEDAGRKAHAGLGKLNERTPRVYRFGLSRGIVRFIRILLKTTLFTSLLGIIIGGLLLISYGLVHSHTLLWIAGSLILLVGITGFVQFVIDDYD